MPKRSKRRASPTGQPITDDDLQHWPAPEIGTLTDDQRLLYLARKNAVSSYAVGLNLQRLSKTYKLSPRWIRRLFSRCVETHEDGRIWGFRALVAYVRRNSATRKMPPRLNHVGRGGAHSLRTTLELEPEFRAELDNFILKTKTVAGRGHFSYADYDSIAEFAVKKLRELQYECDGKWPFGSESLGYHSFRRYAISLRNDNPTAAAKGLKDQNIQKKLKGGTGIDKPLLAPYERVEMDAHKLDGRFTIHVPDQLGGHVSRLVRRLWVIVLINAHTRAVIGYYLSLRLEVSSVDVLKAIRCAATDWQPIPATIPEFALAPGEGLPQILGAGYIGIPWEETSVDGAMAERAKKVQAALKDVCHSRLRTPEQGYSSRRSMDDRPFIETYFRSLASRGFHKLPNTTGGDRNQGRSKQAEEIAVAAEFSLEYLEELLQKLICQYNNTRHSALGYRSPLEYTRYLYERRSLPTSRIDQVLARALLNESKWCMVKGGYNAGRLPYVAFSNAIYSSKELAVRHDLVGKKVLVTVDRPNDVRTIQCATQNGNLIGTLKAAAPWNGLPHSVEIRAAIVKFRNSRNDFPSSSCWVTGFLRCIEENSGKLPVHPAYLAMRRILQDLEQLDHPESDSPPVQNHDDRNVAVPAPARTLSATAARRTELPARRKAKS